MSVYEFGSFSLDIKQRCIKRNGQLFIIPDKLFDILTLLIENNGRVVTKEELMLEIWGEAAVEDSNLTVSISRIRKILSEREGPRKYILTFPRRGYRFIASVRRVNSITLLPFSNDDAYARPNRRIETAVLDRNSADYACLRAGAQTDEEGCIGDVVNPKERPAFVTGRPESGEAYVNILMGRHHWSRHTRDGLKCAIAHFQQALDVAPSHLSAYATQVDCYLRLATNYFIPEPARKPEMATNGLSTGFRDSSNLRIKWEATTAERERTRAHELGLRYPDLHQWQAISLFARVVYETVIESSVWESPGADSTARLPVFNSIQRLLPAELLHISCMIARDQIEGGNCEAAYLMLRSWYEIGTWPKVHGLSPESSADLLFTAGVLAGRLAQSRHIQRGQIHAEGLLNGALSLFQQLGLKTRAAECRSELGRCYDRQGLFDLAQACFFGTLEELPTDERELSCRTLLRLAFAEMKRGRLRDSLAILNECRELARTSLSTEIFFQIEMATANGELAIAEENREYFKIACDYYERAIAATGEVGHHSRGAVLETNHGHLQLAFGNIEEAQSCLFRARELFDNFSNRCPQLDENLARLHCEKGEYDLANKAIARSVTGLEMYGEEQAILAESLRTQGRILARLQQYREAQRVLDRAFQVAKGCDDNEGAGLALLILIEELSPLLEDGERKQVANAMISMLSNCQRTAILKRLERFTV